jgi:hypothetical protein
MGSPVTEVEDEVILSFGPGETDMTGRVIEDIVASDALERRRAGPTVVLRGKQLLPEQ